MAKIIDPNAAPRPIARQTGGIARLAVVGPSGAEGQGMAQLGQEIDRGADEIFRAQKIEEDRANTLRAEEAFTNLRERQLDLSIGEANGFARIKGSDAVTRPIFPEYTKRFEDAEREIAAGLSNDEQRGRFKARAGVARLQYQEEILRHLAREGDVYAKEVYDGTVATEQRNAVARWESPADVALSLDRIAATVTTRAERYGWAPEYTKAIQQSEAGKVHAAVVGQAIASGNYKYAQSWYDRYKDDIDVNTAKSLERAVEDGTQKELMAGYINQFLAQRESMQGLRELEKSVLKSGLDDTRKNIMQGRILGRIDRLEARGERERAMAERQLGGMIDQVNQNTLAGMPATVEQMEPIMALAKGTPLEAQAHEAVRLADATGKFAVLSPFQQAAEITAAERTVRADPSKFDRRVLDAWKQIHERQGDMLRTDPVTFAVRQGVAEPIPLDLTQPATQADGLAARYALSRSLAVKYGSPVKPLTEPERLLVSRAIDGANWKERRDYLGSIFQASNGDVSGYSSVLAQIAPDHPVTAVAGEYAAKGRAQAADLMLQGEALLRPNTKADGKPDGGALVPMPPEQDLRRQFDIVVRDSYAGRAEARNAMYQGARSIYAKLSADAGDKDTKQVDGERWEEAIRLATGGIEKYQGRATPMPYGMPIGTFKDEVRRRTEDMETAGTLPPGITSKTLRELPLEPIGDGRYVFRSGDGIMVSRPAYGKAIIQNKDGSISTERTITVEADGRHYLIPTIVGGKEVSQDQAVKLWEKGTNKAVGDYGSAAEAERAARARTAEIGRQLQPTPIILDFNRSAAFRPSGYGQVAPTPTAPRSRPTFGGPGPDGTW